ncbi:MAG: ERV1/ALR-related protein [Candidatus Roizmanbacteria bacterium]
MKVICIIKLKIPWMNPNYWGPGLWTYIHSVAAVALTADQRAEFRELIYHLAKTLPCKKCKDHFRENLVKFPIERYMVSAVSMFTWTYIMHDAVNHAQGKTGAGRPSYQDMLKKYFNEATGDQEAVGDNDYKDSVCRDACDSVKSLSLSNDTTSTPLSENSTSKTFANSKYKVWRK